MTLPNRGTIDFAAIRSEFPRAEERLWLAAAESHPYSIHTLDALEQYIQYRTHGPAEKRDAFTAEMQTETKTLFASLINAKPSEIAFVQSTTDGENVVLAGLGLSQPGGQPGSHQAKGNIVIDDLHFEASKYLYSALEQAGNIELRVVKHRNWQIEIADIESVIDEDTLLVSIALVSQVNGYLGDIKAISQIAHAYGAYVYADIIQAAGCVPIDVQAMGIDFAATNSYKWLMGDFGIGCLYVREGLHNIVQQTRYCTRQIPAINDFDFEISPGATRYEGSGISSLSGICLHSGLKYLSQIGIENIRTHVKPLVDRLQRELPTLGYCSITPPDAPTPIVSFLPANLEQTQAKLDRAFDHPVVSFRSWYWTTPEGQREMVRGIRFGISVYNNDEDIDKILEALS